LKIDSDFPRSPPKGYFLTKIFHPNVAVKGDICVNTLKRDWDPSKWSLSHILSVIRCLLIIPFPESSLNEEAGRLFMDDYQEYSRMAKMMTNIYAMLKESQDENDSNNTYLADECTEKKPEEEVKSSKQTISFKFQNGSNLDASMEEEKAPLQNF
jgi:ubiquitin-conjugating enzyme E2 S